MATNPVIVEKVNNPETGVADYTITYDSTSTAEEVWTESTISARRAKIATNIANYEALTAELEAEDARLIEFQAAITAYNA